MADKKKKKSVPQRVIHFFEEGAKWTKDVVRDEDVRASVRTDIGLPPEGTSKKPDPNDDDDRFANIEAYGKNVNPDQEALSASIADLKAIYEAITAVVKAKGVSDEALTDQATHQFLRLMSINFLRLRVPFLFWSGQLLGFIEQGFSTDTIPKPIGEAIVSFFKDPPAAIGQVYGSLETEEDAQRISHGIFIPAGVLLGFLYRRTKYLPINKPAAISYGWVPSADSVTPNGDRLSERAFSFLIKGSTNLKVAAAPSTADPCNPPDVPSPNQSLETEVTATFMMVPRQHFGRAGLFASFGGSGQLQLQLDDDWKLTLGPKSSGAINFFFGEGGVDVGGPKDAAFSISIEHLKKEEELPEIIPLTDKTRLEFGHLSFFAEGSLNGVKAVARAKDCALVIASNNDAITERTVRTDQFRVDFDLGLGIAGGHFFIEGGSGLEATLPGSKSLGPLTVQALTVRLIPGGGPSKADFTFEVLATLQVKLGPLLITVQKVGLGAEIDFFDDFRFGFRRPEGLAILINTSAVKGGGFLGHSPTTGEYFGALELTINESWSVKAIGVVGTKMPDGSRGFSFAAIITASGFRLNLGLGFQLTGVGGIIGLDRTFNLDKLEAKLKQGILRNLLFPPNPVANATAILADISQVFPPARDHYVMGLMFRFVWGSDKLVTIDLAAIISDHVTILGIVDVYFPLPKKALVEVHVHVMGDIDIKRKRIFVRAELINSQIFGFTLKGSAAMLLTWGDDPVFILSFGGFNKRYEPQLPSGFPKLDRLQVPLANTDGFKATFKAYLAVTSNSFQIGGSVELKAGGGKFTIEGSLSIDALFQSGHPTFIFDLDASIALKAWGVTLFKVDVKGTLEGGHPWHARGSASFEIWIFDFSVDFDEEWGGHGGEQSLPSVDVNEQMIAAFTDARNWNAELPAEAEGLVTLQPSTSVSDAAAVLHPLSGLSITQRIAPLNVTLSRVGNARPKGQNRFSIERVSVGNAALEVDPIKEHFARSQFLDMTDDEKLGTPAFEKMDSGVRVGTARVRHGTPVTASMECETFVYRGKSGKTERGGVKAVSEELLRRSLGISAAASAPSAVRLRVPPPVVKVKSYQYVVVRVGDQSHVTAQPLNTYTEAVQAMRERIAAQPHEKTQLQVLEVTA